MDSKLLGVAEMRTKLNNLIRRMPEETGKALYQEMLIEEKESRNRTPVMTGALRASHVTKRPEVSGRDISVTIEVGGPSVPYALKVHEDLEADHRVGQAKFLESTLLESRSHMLNRLAARIDLNRLAGK